jgi:hypothetical protein
MSDKRIQHIFIGDHANTAQAKNAQARWESYSNGYRSTFMVFDANNQYLGTFRTPKIKKTEQKSAYQQQLNLVKQAYPNADLMHLVKLDGNASAEFFVEGDQNPSNNRDVALSYRHPLLLVRPLTQVEREGWQGVNHFYNTQAIEQAGKINVERDKRQDLHDEGKVKAKFGSTKGAAVSWVVKYVPLADQIAAKFF